MRCGSIGASINPKATMIVATVIFAATLLFIPFIGGEFMPHLDEGALWIRATMPYTVSFDTASKFSPQVRDILLKYPMVTDVGSELGPPGRRHRPHRLLQRRVLRGPEALRRLRLEDRLHPQQGGADRGHSEAAPGISRRDLQLHAARRGCR